MNKAEFQSELRRALSGLPQADAEERVSFYSEMIDDRMEEGLTEEEAVAGLGPVDAVASQIIAETPITKIVKEKIKPKRGLKAWEIVLIVLGFPVWFPLLVAAGAILFSLYVTVWSLIIALWAIELSFWTCAIGGLFVSIVYFTQGFVLPGIAALGVALFFAGISIFTFSGCVAASKGILRATEKFFLTIKSKILGKESAK